MKHFRHFLRLVAVVIELGCEGLNAENRDVSLANESHKVLQLGSEQEKIYIEDAMKPIMMNLRDNNSAVFNFLSFLPIQIKSYSVAGSYHPFQTESEKIMA